MIQQTIDDCISVSFETGHYQPSDFAVKLYPIDTYGFSETQQWKAKAPCVKLLPQDISMSSIIGEHKLFIYTYNNGTGWLELASSGVPVCLFFDPQKSPIAPPFVPYFDVFQSVGLFHSSKESLIDFLLKIGDDPQSWFYSDCQSAWLNFATHACRPISRRALRITLPYLFNLLVLFQLTFLLSTVISLFFALRLQCIRL